MPKYFNYLEAQKEKQKGIDAENDPITDSIKKRAIIGGTVRSVLKPTGRQNQPEIFYNMHLVGAGVFFDNEPVDEGKLKSLKDYYNKQIVKMPESPLVTNLYHKGPSETHKPKKELERMNSLEVFKNQETTVQQVINKSQM